MTDNCKEYTHYITTGTDDNQSLNSLVDFIHNFKYPKIFLPENQHKITLFDKALSDALHILKPEQF